MPKHSWSFTALKDFKGCARRYHANKVLKLYPFEETEAIKYGNVVHKACEEYIRDGKPLPQGMEQFQPMLDALNAIPGEKICEQKMAVREDFTPCGYFDKKVWCRGAADLIIINGDVAFIVDFKTGSAKYPDKDQLHLMAAMVFEHYPEVQTVKAALAFIVHDVFIKATYKRENRDKMWAKWVTDTDDLEAAFEGNVWHPNPSPLCGWCNHEACEHYTRR